MRSLYDFSKKLKELNDAQNYLETLSYFKKNKINFNDQEISKNAYIISDMLKACRYTNNFSIALKFLESYKISINPSVDKKILIQYGWLLYSWYKFENKLSDNDNIELIEDFYEEENKNYIDNNFAYESNSEVEQKIKEILQILIAYSDDNNCYNLLSKLLNIVVKTEKKKNNPNWNLINEICDFVPPEKLSIKCETIEIVRNDKKNKLN